MKIIGYSERGAMDALFYGMALNNNGDSQMLELLKLANIEGSFSGFTFTIYNEFSLSEFGDPDMVIIAKKNETDDDSVVFFVEAKVSNGSSYKINHQKKYHEEYIDNGKYVNGHASNLFFQLRLKHYFFNTIIKSQKESISIGESELIEKNKDRNGKNRFRTIGNNPIVKKFTEVISRCKKAYYIAIIPQQDAAIENPKGLPESLVINYVSWEDIHKSEKLSNLLKETFDFNKDGNFSQILNKPNNN